MKFIISKSIFIIIIIFSITGCGNNENTKSTEEKKEENHDIVILKPASIKEIDLKIDTVSLKKFTEFIYVPAVVIPDQDNEAQVGSLVQGRVKNVLVKPGQHVSAGQILMNIEGLEIGVIKSDFLKAKANLDYQKVNFERQQTLKEQNIGSQKTLLEAKAEYEKALAEYKSEDKKIHSIGLTDEEIIDQNNSATTHSAGTLPVRSPIAGIIIERNVVIGQLVDASTNAFRIINTNSVWIDGQINEKDLKKVSEKSPVHFKVSSYPDELFTGKISYIGRIIDEKTRKITIRAEFNNMNSKLKPQMFGELLIPAGNDTASIILPGESIVKMENKEYIFVQKDDTTFEKRAVVCIPAADGTVCITNGLKTGEKVVIRGAFYLKSELLKSELGEE